jgi:hypothetical protein
MKVLAHLRRQSIGILALFLAVTGGTAVALEGRDTVFSDDIVAGAVHTPHLGPGARPHALIMDDLGTGDFSERVPVGGVGKIELTALCLSDGESGFGLPGLDLFVQSSRAVQIGHAFHLTSDGTPGPPIQGETAIGRGGGEAEIFHIESDGRGDGAADGQIAVRDGDHTVTFIVHADTDFPPRTCHITGTATRAAP